jgi:hypothetical protein
MDSKCHIDSIVLSGLINILADKIPSVRAIVAMLTILVERQISSSDKPVKLPNWEDITFSFTDLDKLIQISIEDNDGEESAVGGADNLHK